MVRSSLAKGVCVAAALSGLSAPPAGAIETVQGFNPTPGVNVAPISRVVEINRGPAGGVHVRGPYGGGVYRGPHGGVYGHGPYRGGAYGYHGGGWYGGGWARPGWYGWAPGGAIAAGAALGVLATGAAIAYAGQPPAPGLCWYYTDPSYRQGFWDACQ
jgi:hypothetical protein